VPVWIGQCRNTSLLLRTRDQTQTILHTGSHFKEKRKLSGKEERKKENTSPLFLPTNSISLTASSFLLFFLSFFLSFFTYS
jgi:hypothetical protein